MNRAAEEIILEINEDIAEKLGVEEEEIQPDAHFESDLNSSELELADLIVALEHRYDIEVSPEEIHELETVSDLYALILDKLDEIS
jgi:acyl carrier protein